MKRLYDLLLRACNVGAIAIATVVLLGLGPKEVWIFDTLANLRVHAVGSSIILFLVALMARQKFGLAVNLLVVAAGLFGFSFDDNSQTINIPADSQELTITSSNLGHMPAGNRGFVEYIETSTADVLVLQEYKHWHHTQLEELEEIYPFDVSYPADGAFGIAVYSRHPIIRSEILAFRDSDIPFIRADIEVEKLNIEVIGVHLQAPINVQTFNERNTQIEQLANMPRNHDTVTLICGDWNLTPWSGWYAHLTDNGLNDGDFPSRFKPSWPVALSLFGIPIDHCFAAGPATIIDRSPVQSIGADHAPIEFAISIDIDQEPSVESDNNDRRLSMSGRSNSPLVIGQ